MLKEITIIPGNKKLYVTEGSNLLKSLQEKGYFINSPCSAMGLCGKCSIKIIRGHIPVRERDRALLSEDKLKENFRLACGVTVEDNIAITLPVQSEDIPLKETISGEHFIKTDSGIKKYFLSLSLPSSQDQRSDTQRIQDRLQTKLSFPLSILRKIPGMLRNNDFKVTVTVNGTVTVLDMEPGDRTEANYGIAIDIGTTTVVVYLLSLITGEEISAKSITNPQTPYGADVISRINYVHKNGESGLRELHDKIINGINSIIQELCWNNNISYKNIYKACIAGNPTMIQLFLGIDPSYLDKAPYIPVLRDVISFKSKEIGMKINPEAPVQILPSVSAYIGSDITAGIIATGLDRTKNLKVLIDIGTNGEIVIAYKNRIIACSAAAGPAFEGACIERGMRAQEGAIHKININNRAINFETFGNIPPLGICGSGLIDLIAALREMDIITESGKLTYNTSLPVSDRVGTIREKEKCFNIYKDIYVSQKDIREVQLAKGAIRAGIEILLRECDVTTEDIEHIYLAGAFGNFLKKESVKSIGLIPDIKSNKIKSVGNSAGHGVKLCLLNQNKLKQVQKISEKVEYIELSYSSVFNDEFIKQMSFPQQTGKRETRVIRRDA
ncbi:MAG: ASKHA domain-containing protein [Candidatus Eremiobacterota bacterium]